MANQDVAFIPNDANMLAFAAFPSGSDPGGGGDAVKPVVSNVSPPINSDIDPKTSINFDVTDNILLKKVIIIAKFDKGAIWENVFDGLNFAPNYANDSIKTTITNGFHFSLQRLGGWPSKPNALVVAFDTSGNEAE